MKQKKSHWWIYIVCTVLLAGIIFVAVKDLSPQQTHIEQILPAKK